MNAVDLLQQKKLLPDIGTWIQCFVLYAGIICTETPGRLPDLLSYLYQITRASQRYLWPSWVIFDQNVRQEMADQGSTQFAHLDATLYTQCFNGQAKEVNAWCQFCHSLDHTSDMCQFRLPPAKRPKPSPVPPDQVARQTPQTAITQICRNYNNKPKGCKFGNKCRRIHRCMECNGLHPKTLCPRASSTKPEGPTPH